MLWSLKKTMYIEDLKVQTIPTADGGYQCLEVRDKETGVIHCY